MSEKNLLIIRAAWAQTMIPGHEPINDAAIVHDGRFLVDIGPYAAIRKTWSAPVTDLGSVTLCPGLINAHAHLEMSHLKGKISGGQGFAPWIRNLIAAPMYELDREAVALGLKEMKDSGTVFVGDISTRNIKTIAGILENSGFFFVVFAETIFFAPPAPDAAYIPEGTFLFGRLSAAGHAPYSTHPDRLRGAKAQCRAGNLPFSLHLAENDEELSVLMDRPNEYADLLREANIPLDNFTPPMNGPVEYARDLGILDEQTLAVHCVKVTDAEIEILRETGTNVCLCPRSNEYIGEGRAPWEKILGAGINCCLGTDGLCSNTSLNLWHELAHFKQRYEDALNLEHGLALLTRNPARAMGVQDLLGTLEKGKAARWTAVPEEVIELFRER